MVLNIPLEILAEQYIKFLNTILPNVKGSRVQRTLKRQIHVKLYETFYQEFYSKPNPCFSSEELL